MPPPIAAFFLVACTFLSCGVNGEKNQEDRIIQLLARHRKGLEEKDLQLYLSAVSPNYDDGLDTYDTIKIKVEKLSAQYSILRLRIEKRTIYIDKNKATVVEEYRLTGRGSSGGKLDVHRQGVLNLEHDEASGWKIVNGIDLKE
jgi:hypothetical protein